MKNYTSNMNQQLVYQLVYAKANQLNCGIIVTVGFKVYFAANTWIISSLLEILRFAGWNSLSKQPVLCRQQSETLHWHFQVHWGNLGVKGNHRKVLRILLVSLSAQLVPLLRATEISADWSNIFIFQKGFHAVSITFEISKECCAVNISVQIL